MLDCNFFVKQYCWLLGESQTSVLQEFASLNKVGTCHQDDRDNAGGLIKWEVGVACKSAGRGWSTVCGLAKGRDIFFYFLPFEESSGHLKRNGGHNSKPACHLTQQRNSHYSQPDGT